MVNDKDMLVPSEREGEVGDYFRYFETYPKEEPVVEGEWKDVTPGTVEGEWRDLPPEGDGGIKGSSDREASKKKEKLYREAERARRSVEKSRKLGAKISWEASKAELEEAKAQRRRFSRQYRTDFPKVASRVSRAFAPARQPKGFYTGKPSLDLYIPGGATRQLTAPPSIGSDITEVQRPKLGMLQRQSAPPSTPPIGAPSTWSASSEGIGKSISRLQRLTNFPNVDQAVYDEIKANGDVDTKQNIRNKVSMLGFSVKEVDTALSRLRNMGLVKYSSRAKEYEVTGNG